MCHTHRNQLEGPGTSARSMYRTKRPAKLTQVHAARSTRSCLRFITVAFYNTLARPSHQRWGECCFDRWSGGFLLMFGRGDAPQCLRTNGKAWGRSASRTSRARQCWEAWSSPVRKNSRSTFEECLVTFAMGRVALTCRRWQHWSVLARQSCHSNSRSCLVLFDISWDDMNISFCSLRVPLGDADNITRTLQSLYGQYPRNSQFLL